MNISPNIRALADQAESAMSAIYHDIDAISRFNTEHVLDCFRQCEVSESLFAPSTGYGYGDRGRDKLDEVFAEVFETEDAIKNGADEIDYMINQTELKNGNWDYIQSEMEQITAMCHKYNVPCKVIFENCYLTKDEIRKLSEIALVVKPDFIKTSTGFGTGGATLEDVKLMKSVVGDAVKVKAAGGIRDWKTCKAMIEAGAERIGTSASLKILEEFINEYAD
mgnify:CR=1 FL=1